ncbi:hypothetical protein ACF0H5_003000 [Mactra antiquata]
MSALFATVFGVMVAVASAHMCLLSPKQRGTISGLNSAGSNDCVLLSSPCGGRAEGTYETTFTAGQKATVIFQKNLDHWDSKTPGRFDIKLWKGNTATTVGSVPDMGEQSLHLYNEEVTIPATMHGAAILQVTYVTNNPNAPAVFYQCADVMIH